MGYNYSKQDFRKEHMARAVGRVLGISFKASIEICNRIRGQDVSKAKKILNDIISMKVPIKFTRFTNGAGHKSGIGPGKYPLKAAGEILKLLETAEANAQFKGLNTSNLILLHINAKNGGNQWRYGRIRRRRMKRTTIEVVIEEGKKKISSKEEKPAHAAKKAGEPEKIEKRKESEKDVRKDAPKSETVKSESTVKKTEVSKEDKK